MIRPWFCVLAALCIAGAGQHGNAAANPCVLSSGGMGGTGAPAALAEYDSGPGGIGGTGLAPDQGIGGTGAQAAVSEKDGGSGGIGGTGRAPEQGIGGTGAPATVDSGGMGGTGSVADEGGMGGTGIVGVITGFGSICVGGIEIHYGASTPISSDGQRLNATQLKIGHVVQVQARGVGASVRAVAIELVHVVSGPVRAADARTGRLEVLGQQIRASAEVVAQAQAAARAGHPVEVSGLRARNGEIVATRVDAAPGMKEFGVIGPVESLSASGARIGNLPIKLDAGQARAVKAGQSVEVCGSFENGTLRARTVESKGAAALRDKGVDRLVVEGFVGKRARDEIQVGDATIKLDGRTRIAETGDIDVDQRVVVAARAVNGKWIADRVERVRDRDSADSRRVRGNKRAGDQDQGSDNGGKDEGGGNGDADKEGGSGSSHGGDGKDNDRKSDSTSGGNSDSRHGGDSKGGSDARKDVERSDPERASRDSPRDPTRESGRDADHDATRPPREPKPERAPGSSSHGAKPDRVRDK